MNKSSRLLSLTITVMVLLSPTANPQKPRSCSFGTPYRGCAACGTVLSIKAQIDNQQKNRDQAPDPNKLKILTVSDIRNNGKSFFPDMVVEVTGYVASVVVGAQRETANCLRTDLRDIMINIVAAPNEASEKRKYVVLEISPRWEKRLGFDDSNYNQMFQNIRRQMVGRWVMFRGWMFNDSVHIAESESTNPGFKSNWRATTWEIHPVTYYKVLPAPPQNAVGRMRIKTDPQAFSSKVISPYIDTSFSIDVGGWRREKNHSTIVDGSDNCLTECYDHYLDTIKDCSANHGNAARRRCLRNANKDKRNCRYGCAP